MYHDLMATALFSRKALSVLRPTNGRAGGKDLDNRGMTIRQSGLIYSLQIVNLLKILKVDVSSC